MGYTINRVSLFALIFSIGILVDDAIVVVENIARHWAMRDGRGLAEAAVEAVAEVGNPTIVATLTIIAALLPMMFVSGMMGPYMSPIPANASIAMLFSFFIAVTVTPWLLLRFARRRFDAKEAHPGGDHDIGAMGRFYARIARPLLKGRIRSKLFLVTVGIATRRGLRAVRDQGRSRQASAVRQQVGDPGRSRPAARREPRGHGPGVEGGGRPAQGPARTCLDPGLCGDGGAVQLQRPRAPLLSARGSEPGRSFDQSRPQGRASAREPCDCARRPASARRSRAAGRLGAQGGRGSAGTAGAGDAAGRNLWTGCGKPPRARRESAQGVRVGRFHRRRRRQLWRAVRSPALRDRPGGARISRRRGAGGLRHDRRRSSAG